MLLVIVMQIKLNVVVVAEKNRVLSRVSCCSIACTTGVIATFMGVYLRKARDICDEIKKTISFPFSLPSRVDDLIV